MIRVPIEPIERWFMVAHPAANHSIAEQEENQGRPTADRLGEACGVKRCTVGRWRRDGIPYWAASDAATQLGWHPNAFWDNWDQLDPSVDEAERTRKRLAATARRFQVPEWFVELKRAALLESWQLRAECDGTAGVLARQILAPTEGEAA